MSQKLILAPDSFKGSLAASAVAAAMARGALRALPEATVVQVPLADGGEGTVEALVRARGGVLVDVPVSDPLGRPITAQYGRLSPDTVVAEMASASGLLLLTREERNPFSTSSAGTGQLIRAALECGASELILGVGGSATVDGGAGALQALGAQLLDRHRQPIGPGNAGLADLEHIDLSGVDARLRSVRFRVASDVRNPLLGPSGAAAVFGPQKGASPDAIAILEAHLAHFAQIIYRDVGLEVDATPGGGAAGGLVAGLSTIGAVVESGIELVLDIVSFSQHLRGADLVLTGEGKIDAQTAHGKVISGVLHHARSASVPVVALAGMVVRDELHALYEGGLVAAFSIVPSPTSEQQAFAQAAPFVEATTEAVVRLWRAGMLAAAR